MKFVVAIIQPHRLDKVKLALSFIGIQGMTVTEVRGFGRQKGRADTDGAPGADLIPKLKLDIAVADEAVERVHEALIRTARSGKIGDGKIFVRGMEEIVRIRNGQKGPIAL